MSSIWCWYNYWCT